MSDLVDMQENDDAAPLVRPEDIRSTSRSCLVVILLFAVILLMLCIFVVVQTWIR
ncbi:MAG: hypothetical protein KC435_07715 [Thermomicrobiales bacterium]|nr:hypothetical protein [Thermomicrobiales bacterium]